MSPSLVGGFPGENGDLWPELGTPPLVESWPDVYSLSRVPTRSTTHSRFRHNRSSGPSTVDRAAVQAGKCVGGFSESTRKRRNIPCRSSNNPPTLPGNPGHLPRTPGVTTLQNRLHDLESVLKVGTLRGWGWDPTSGSELKQMDRIHRFGTSVTPTGAVQRDVLRGTDDFRNDKRSRHPRSEYKRPFPSSSGSSPMEV